MDDVSLANRADSSRRCLCNQREAGSALSSTKDNVLNSLLAAHEAWFDVSRNQEFAGRVFPGYAEFHTHGEQYVLVKRAKLWEVASHEYIFFAESDHLTAPEISELIEFVKTQGIKKVNPDEPNHMQSFVSLVVITDAADDEVLKIARRARFRKNFKLGLNGWADLRVAILDLKSASVITNAMGKEMKKTLESNLQASLS